MTKFKYTCMRIFACILYFYYKVRLPKITNKKGRASRDAMLLLTFPLKNIFKSFLILKNSKSQLRQDLMALVMSDFKKNGYFVEFGATNGVDLSNTWILEKYFGWRGILAEPAKVWHENLFKNRNCYIETQCVWRASNEIITFNEVAIPEISTISLYSDLDDHQSSRKIGTTYEVKTISLSDLLEKYDAPKNIDFLSIDTEGSEYEILAAFDFKKYQINVICCEHNYTPMREQIYLLLTKNGFIRKYEELSEIDDWYFLAIPHE